MAATGLAGDSTTDRAHAPGTGVHPVDEMLGPHKLIPLAIQHVLVMYAGAIASR